MFYTRVSGRKEKCERCLTAPEDARRPFWVAMDLVPIGSGNEAQNASDTFAQLTGLWRVSADLPYLHGGAQAPTKSQLDGPIPYCDFSPRRKGPQNPWASTCAFARH